MGKIWKKEKNTLTHTTAREFDPSTCFRELQLDRTLNRPEESSEGASDKRTRKCVQRGRYRSELGDYVIMSELMPENTGNMANDRAGKMRYTRSVATAWTGNS